MTFPRFDAEGFRRRLQAARHERGLTVEGAAALCNMPKASFETNLYGPNLPTASVLFKIALGLGVSVDWLLFGYAVPRSAAGQPATTPTHHD